MSHDSIQSECFNQFRWQSGESNVSVWSKHPFMSFHGSKPPHRRAPLISINSHREALTWQISLDGSPLTCNSTRRLTLGLQPSFSKKEKSRVRTSEDLALRQDVTSLQLQLLDLEISPRIDKTLPARRAYACGGGRGGRDGLRQGHADARFMCHRFFHRVRWRERQWHMGELLY